MIESQEKQVNLFRKSIGVTAAKWIQDETLMCNHIRACVAEAEDLFDRRFDEEYYFVWSIPNAVDAAWKESLLGVCRELDRAETALQLVKAVHPGLPFNLQSLSAFRQNLLIVEQGVEMSHLAHLHSQINKNLQQLVGWIVMRRQFQKTGEPPKSDVELGDRGSNGEQKTKKELAVIDAMELCEKTGIEATLINSESDASEVSSTDPATFRTGIPQQEGGPANSTIRPSKEIEPFREEQTEYLGLYIINKRAMLVGRTGQKYKGTEAKFTPSPWRLFEKMLIARERGLTNAEAKNANEGIGGESLRQCIANVRRCLSNLDITVAKGDYVLIEN